MGHFDISRETESTMVKVVAGEDIQQGSSSYDIKVDNLTISTLTTKNINLHKGPMGRLTSGEDEILIQNIKWSDDIHGCNFVLEKGIQDKSVRIICAKNIKKGDLISMWFSQELLAAMDIPFLNPVNIRGEKNYTCHRCGRIFEYPNPLKVHLGLNCGVIKKKELWKRLKSSLSINNSSPGFIFKLSLKKRKSDINYKPPSPVFSSYSSPSPDRLLPHSEERPSSEPPRNSAFKPYSNIPAVKQEIKMELRIPDEENYLNQQAAEIETLVSNLGQSKQGHLCLYCGKIYSRKYGLKIHIRTHTGFKPLKCKYCMRPFGDPSNLNKHVRLHAETDTPYRCGLCGKMLVRRRDLERHMKSRHNVDEDF